MKEPKEIILDGGKIYCYRDEIKSSCMEPTCVIIPQLVLKHPKDMKKLIDFLDKALLWLESEEKNPTPPKYGN